MNFFIMTFLPPHPPAGTPTMVVSYLGRSATPSQSSSSLIDAPPAELTELWKRTEFIRFSEYLKTVEAEARESVLREIDRVRKIEKRFRLKLVEMEERERELKNSEAELKRTREDIAFKLKRVADDHAAEIKRIHDHHGVAIRSEREKLKVEELKRKSAEIELAKLRNQLAKTSTKSTPTTSTRQSSEQQLLQAELTRTQQREQLLIKSRDHFRSAVIKLSEPKKTPAQIKRAELIASGMYTVDDPVIKALDRHSFSKGN
jgi:hypothetical protein